MAIRRLGLTRDQLAKFLVEHEQIRQFELLFTAVDELQTTTVDTISFDAGAALAGVNKLAGVVAQLAQDGAIEASTALSVAQAAERALNAVSDLAMVGATLPPLVPKSCDVAMIGATAPPTTPPSIDLAMVGATLPPPVPKRRNVGAWYDMTDQGILVINTPQVVTFDSTSIERGVWRDPVNSRIHVADAGVYNVEFSAQLDKTSGGADFVYIWIRVNSIDVPDSATLLRMKGNNDELVAAWNFLLELAGGDYVELMWASPTLDMRLEHFAASAFAPAIPSVILTITQEA